MNAFSFIYDYQMKTVNVNLFNNKHFDNKSLVKVSQTYRDTLTLIHARIKFDLEKLKDPEVAEAFHAMIGGKFAALTILDPDGTDIVTLINTFNTAVTNTASEILGKHRPVKKPWVTADLLDLCDKRRELKKKYAEGVSSTGQPTKKGMKKAKMNWIEEQCQDIEDSMKKNNSKKIYQLVKDLTSTKQ